MKKYFSCCLFLLSFVINAEGFIAGTPVKTPTGYGEIQDIKVGDSVLSCDSKNHCVEREVTQTFQKTANGYLEIRIGNSLIGVDENHLFYSPQTTNWILANDLTSLTTLMNTSYKTPQVKEIRYVLKKVILYNLSVAEHHNFYVSHDDILVHNIIGIVFVIGPALTIIIPEIVATIGIAVIGTAAVAPIAIGAGKLLASAIHAATSTSHSRPYESHQENAKAPKASAENQYDGKKEKADGPKDSKGPEPSPNFNKFKKEESSESNEKPKIVFSEKGGQIKHIFRKAEGHVEDTPENRKMILDTANEPHNYIGTDKDKTDWYQKPLPSGKQVWVQVWGSQVNNAGVNDRPRDLVKEKNLEFK